MQRTNLGPPARNEEQRCPPAALRSEHVPAPRATDATGNLSTYVTRLRKRQRIGFPTWMRRFLPGNALWSTLRNRGVHT